MYTQRRSEYRKGRISISKSRQMTVSNHHVLDLHSSFRKVLPADAPIMRIPARYCRVVGPPTSTAVAPLLSPDFSDALLSSASLLGFWLIIAFVLRLYTLF